MNYTCSNPVTLIGLDDQLRRRDALSGGIQRFLNTLETLCRYNFW